MQHDWFMFHLRSTYKNRLDFPFNQPIDYGAPCNVHCPTCILVRETNGECKVTYTHSNGSKTQHGKFFLPKIWFGTGTTFPSFGGCILAMPLHNTQSVYIIGYSCWNTSWVLISRNLQFWIVLVILRYGTKLYSIQSDTWLGRAL